MKTLIFIMLIVALLCTSVYAGKRVKIYDENSKWVGTIENDRVYDNNYQYRGHIEKDRIYDENSRYRGHIERERSREKEHRHQKDYDKK